MLINLLEGPSSGEIHLLTNLLKRTERLITVTSPPGGCDIFDIRAVNDSASSQ